MALQDWFYRYFIETYGYNPVNTTVYAIVLIAFVYAIFKTLERLNVKMDKRLALSVSPFVVLGSSIRVLEDSRFLSGYVFMTPWIYFLTFGITFLVLLISLAI